MPGKDHVLDLIRSHLDEMFPAERKAAEYILEHPENTSRINITELAELSGSSDATVIRMCKRLGFTGFCSKALRQRHDRPAVPDR
ncbi:MAG TPA: hypothetical protein IAB84_03915 [Candidatus Choladousia intestinigallinarum]|nr:hypothetical protein [Candidatus Choladousia intestinigallinarum]